MISKIVDGIHLLRIPIPYDTGMVNSYLIKGEKGYTIIDTGDHTEETKQIWSEIFAAFPIEKAVITHGHYDHMGAAAWMQEQFGIPIWMSNKTNEHLKEIRGLFVGEKYANPVPDLFEVYGGPHNAEDEEYYVYHKYKFEPDHIFYEDEHIPLGDRSYRAIWTPGHSPDHFCFYDTVKEMLFAGDHILNEINPIVLIQQPEDNPLKDYLHAIEKIEQFPAQYMLTGHGEMIKDPSGRIQELKKHYQRRWKQICVQLDNEAKSAFDVSKQIYNSHMSAERSLAGFMQTITNLEYLQSIGSVKKEKRDGVFYFYR